MLRSGRCSRRCLQSRPSDREHYGQRAHVCKSRSGPVWISLVNHVQKAFLRRQIGSTPPEHPSASQRRTCLAQGMHARLARREDLFERKIDQGLAVTGVFKLTGTPLAKVAT